VSLAGKVVVVTGGSRGIGRACVLHAVGAGARVVFCSRSDGPESREVEAAAAEAGGSGAALGVAADVSNEQDVTRLFDTARRHFGAVHGTVNNAAVIRDQLLVSATTADWDAVIEANLTGGFLVAREAIRLLLGQGTGGHLVAIGTLSQRGVSGNASYAVSKGGLEGLTREIARQYAHVGIVSSMVVPGYVETALSAGMSESSKRALVDGCPMRRPGSPGEIASVVTWLLSDAATGLDGEVLFVSGGLREVPL
jgi:3-oxoacyl-[acyl-carrier protein] reductase